MAKKIQDSTAFSQVSSQFSQQGVPASIWEPIVSVESGGNVNAVGDNGTSFGLLQLHTPGGQGSSWSQYDPAFLTSDPQDASVLENQSLPMQQRILSTPDVNASIGSAPIASAYKQGKLQGLKGQALLDYTASHSGHPYNNGVPALASGSEQTAINQAYASGIGTTKQLVIYDGSPNEVASNSTSSGGSSSSKNGIPAIWTQIHTWESTGTGPSFGPFTISESFMIKFVVILLGVLLMYIGMKSIITPKTVLGAVTSDL